MFKSFASIATIAVSGASALDIFDLSCTTTMSDNTSYSFKSLELDGGYTMPIRENGYGDFIFNYCEPFVMDDGEASQ